MEEIILQNNKKIYFASDFHLGAPNLRESLKREKTICEWLDFIKKDAQFLFLVGDLFDFWFEHKTTVPKGHTRFLGKLAELSDAGIDIIIFTGNHDMWMRDYFQIEFGAKIYRNPQSYLINGQKFYVGHGDGLGPGDYPYKFLKKVFENSFCRFLFGNLLHPNLSLKLGYLWASHSWKKHDKEKDVYVFKSLKDEILFQYCQESQTNKIYDFYVFGHRHYTFDEALVPSGRYINLGDWIKFQSFACFDGQNLKLEIWENK